LAHPKKSIPANRSIIKQPVIFSMDDSLESRFFIKVQFEKFCFIIQR